MYTTVARQDLLVNARRLDLKEYISKTRRIHINRTWDSV